MANIDYYLQLASSLCLKAREQATAIISLGDNFAREAIQLSRHDQAMRLRRLELRVQYEVERTCREEAVAEYASVKLGLSFSTARFAVGAFMANVFGDPGIRLIGRQMLRRGSSKTKPFGTVVVAIGHEGLPDGVKVIPLSRLAREEGVSESEVEEALRIEGLILMTPEDFCNLRDSLEQKVLKGTITLPVSPDQIKSELTSHD